MHQMTPTLKRPAPATKPADPRWSALGLVQAAMVPLSLKDRDIAVLRGLLSFIPADRWDGPLIVFASNAALQARCDGIDERTLRRRLTRLAETGLIRRNLSPNRKRYIVRDHRGEALLTYGFDLAPLRASLERLRSLGEAHASAARQLIARKAVLRDHLYRLTQQGFLTETDADMIAGHYRLLRRKASVSDIDQAIQCVATLLHAQEQAIERLDVSPEMTGSDGQIVRDIQSSDKEYLERRTAIRNDSKSESDEATTLVSLPVCLDAARTSMEFAQTRPRDWRELAALARQLAPAIGVDTGQMRRTTELLGERGASMAILGLVEAYPRIKEPARYLNSLLTRATTVGLDLERMFRSLTGWARFPAGNQSPAGV